MRKQNWFALAVTLLLFAPTMAWANGWNHVAKSLNITLSSTAVGCLVGLVIALFFRAKAGGLFAATIGAGLVSGLFGVVLSVLATSVDFFSNNVGFAFFLAGSAVVEAAAAGAMLALLALGIRFLARRGSPPNPPPA